MKNNFLLAIERLANNKILLMMGIIIVAFNLRPAITSVGPMINLIRSDTGISYGIAGLLTTLPLIAFALISSLAPRMGNRWGNELVILIGLICLGVGISIRSFGIISTLFFGTALIGIGMAIANVLLPGIVKKKFPGKIGLMTGIYSAAMGISASLAPGLSTILSNQLHMGWEKSLFIWGVLVIVGMIIWFPQIFHQKQSAANLNVEKQSSFWFSPVAWQVTLFMGFQSFIFYCMVTWLPELLHSRGLTLAAAAWLLTIFQIVGIPAQFITPIVAGRLSNQKIIAWIIGIINLFGLAGLFLSSNMIMIYLSVIAVGFSQGGALSYALALFGLRTTNGIQAATLSGMAQSVGYLLAALGPLTLGILYDRLHSWTLPLGILFTCAIIMTIVGVAAGRDKVVIPIETNNCNTLVEDGVKG